MILEDLRAAGVSYAAGRALSKRRGPATTEPPPVCGKTTTTTTATSQDGDDELSERLRAAPRAQPAASEPQAIQGQNRNRKRATGAKGHLCELLLAQATLKLTSNFLRAPSLGGLLKALLLLCCWALAVGSLLLLVLCINHFISVRLQRHQQQEPEMEGPNRWLALEESAPNRWWWWRWHRWLLGTPPRGRPFESQLLWASSSRRPLVRPRRAAERRRQQQVATVQTKSAALGSPSNWSGRSSPAGARGQQPTSSGRTATPGRLPAAGQQVPAARAGEPLPELSFRAAPAESQWIPILKPGRRDATGRGAPIAQSAARRPQLPGQGARPTSGGQPRPRQRPMPAQSLNQAASHQFRQRHWRQPRLQQVGGHGLAGEPLAGPKMYKRVLLCDKTLVSLDYIRHLELEPRPHGGAHFSAASLRAPSRDWLGPMAADFELDEIADNLIDHDDWGRMDSASNYTSSSQPATTATTATATITTTTAAATDLLADRAYLLSDDDPLVRCDMWDLEKGLKNRKPPERILRMAVKADFDTVRDAINRCRQLSERTLPPEDEFRDSVEIMSTEDLVSLFSMKRGLIPGTKWCGLGDQATSYNDLGPKHRIDICCRAHDHCPIRSKPFRNDYGILNIGLYTKSHCDCDADFYRCLREVRSRTADMLGNLYFNVMKLQCMREERLKVCREMKPIALGFERCVRYEDSPVKTVFKFTTPPVAY